MVSSSHDDDLEPESDSATDADAVADALTDDDEPQAPTFRHKDNCDCPECEEKVFIFGERHKEFHQGTTTAAAVVTANDAHLPLQLQGSSLVRFCINALIIYDILIVIYYFIIQNPPELLQPEPAAGPSGNASSSNRPALNNDSSDSDIESEQVRRQRARSNKDIVDARRLAANVTTWPPIPRQRVQPQPQTPASASLGVAIAANVNQHVPVPVCVREPQQQPQLPIVTKRRKSLRLMGKAVASKAASKARASRVGVRQSVRLNNATRLLVQQHHRLLQTQHHRQRQTALERGRQIQRHRAQQNHEQIRRDQRRARHQQNPIVQNPIVQNRAIHRHRLACTECTKSFGSKAALDLHQNVHTRRFQCQECGKCFQSNALLGIHQRIHTNDKPFPCDHCNKEFIQYGNMMQHYIFVDCPNNMN